MNLTGGNDLVDRIAEKNRNVKLKDYRYGRQKDAECEEAPVFPDMAAQTLEYLNVGFFNRLLHLTSPLP